MDAESIQKVMESADPVVVAVREMHSPVFPPEGSVWLDDKSRDPKCGGCATGDPFMDPPWPCETITVVAKALGEREA